MFRVLLSSALCAALTSAAWAQAAPEPRVFSEIRVVGNDRFRDGDILATSGLVPGELYSEDDLRSAIEALDFTGEFETIRITSSGDILTIRVEEAASYEGQLSFGLGFESDEGLFGSVGLRLDNALGIGARIRGEITVAEESQEARFSVFDPDALGARLGAGIRLSYVDRAYDTALYAYQRASIAPFLVYQIGTETSFETRLTFADTDISDVDPAASAILQAETGSETAQSIGFSLSHGGIDRSAPNLTWGARFDLDLAGIGGDADFTRSAAEASAFLPLPRGFALRSTVALGHISGTDNYTVRAPDRFVLGGATLRGFERGSISPRDSDGSTVTNLGGNSFAVIRTDLLLPVGDPNSGLDVFAFTDIGSIWDLETDATPSGTLQDDQTWRSSLGLGASVDLGFARFEAYAAITQEGEAEDTEQALGLTVRTGF